MKLSLYLIAVFCLSLSACSNRLSVVKPEVHVRILNESTHDFRNAKVLFGEYVCRWGYVGRSFTKGHAFFPYPITPEAQLVFDEDDHHRVEELDLSTSYVPGKSGVLEFIVYDNRVEVTFVEDANP